MAKKMSYKNRPKRLGKSAFPKLRKNMDYHKKKNQWKVVKDDFSNGVLGA